MTDLTLPLLDVPLTVEDLLIRAKALAGAAAAPEAIEEILHQVAVPRHLGAEQSHADRLNRP